MVWPRCIKHVCFRPKLLLEYVLHDLTGVLKLALFDIGRWLSVLHTPEVRLRPNHCNLFSRAHEKTTLIFLRFGYDFIVSAYLLLLE